MNKALTKALGASIHTVVKTIIVNKLLALANTTTFISTKKTSGIIHIAHATIHNASRLLTNETKTTTKIEAAAPLNMYLLNAGHPMRIQNLTNQQAMPNRTTLIKIILSGVFSERLRDMSLR